MKQRIIIVVAWLAIVIALNLQVRTNDVPLFLHIVSWYMGIAIGFSLYVPIRTGRTVDTMRLASPLARVFISFLWPLYVVIALAAYLASLTQP